MSKSLKKKVGRKMNLKYDGKEGDPLFVFAHGAGASMDSDFMEIVAKGLVLKGIRVARFNFPYMQQRVDTGSRRPPERAPKLIAQFKALLETVDTPCIIGGKSMGGRIASLLAAELSQEDLSENTLKGIACLGFPFHPTGKPEKLRIDHFPAVNFPQLIIQGTRDTLGTKEDVESYDLPKCIEWLWIEDGDHNLKPRVKSGFKHSEHLQKAIDELAVFIKYCLAN